MSANKPNRFWTLFAICFSVVLVVTGTILGGVVAWSEYRPGEPVEISLASPREFQGDITISGAVVNPGLYSFHTTDTLEALIAAAGGFTDSDNESSLTLELYVAETQDGQESQKIDINRAETWLLEALPGIKEIKARAIVDYREKNGFFRSIKEITRVEGIGTSTFEKIKHLITIAD